MTFQLTPIQQRFFTAIIEGKSQAEAYKAAKFPRGGCNLKPKELRTRGSDMANGRRVADALARARAASATVSDITLDRIIQMLLESREIALSSDPPQVSASVAAAAALAKVCGLWIDRKQVGIVHHKPGLSAKAVELSPEEWKAQFTPKRERLDPPQSAP